MCKVLSQHPCGHYLRHQEHEHTGIIVHHAVLTEHIGGDSNAWLAIRQQRVGHHRTGQNYGIILVLKLQINAQAMLSIGAKHRFPHT
jgi:hypothetical protein